MVGVSWDYIYFVGEISRSAVPSDFYLQAPKWLTIFPIALAAMTRDRCLDLHDFSKNKGDLREVFGSHGQGALGIFDSLVEDFFVWGEGKRYFK